MHDYHECCLVVSKHVVYLIVAVEIRIDKAAEHARQQRLGVHTFPT